jgi:peptidoglycan/LPS O-acetylase OafA/YrhL
LKNTNRSLEGLRGAAALLVVLYHIGLLSPFTAIIRNGYLAVDLFFVLSGFVICTAYGDRLETGRDVWRFVVRRIGRLWPLHILTAILFSVFVGTIFALGRMHPHIPTSAEVLSIATMTQGFDFFGYPIGNPVAWSTSDEFYVYFLFAAICVCVRSQRLMAFAIMAVAGFIVTIYIDAPVCAHTGACLEVHSVFGMARCVCGFFVGALVALSRRRLRSLELPAAQMALAIAALAFVAATSEIPLIAFAAPLVFAVLIASLVTDRGPVAFLLQTRFMQYLGRISYALYLAHAVFVMTFAGWLNHDKFAIGYQLIAVIALLMASFALAHLLHRYVEVPCRDRIYAWSDLSVGRNVASPLRERPEDRGHHADELIR